MPNQHITIDKPNEQASVTVTFPDGGVAEVIVAFDDDGQLDVSVDTARDHVTVIDVDDEQVY